MPSKAVGFVIASSLTVILIFGLYSIPAVLAKAKVTLGPISCSPSSVTRGGSHTTPGIKQILCCQTETDSGTGIAINWCTYCDDTQPPSNCGPRFEGHEGGGNPTGVPTPAGNALPPSGNNTGTPPPGSIIKVPVNHTNALSTGANNATSNSLKNLQHTTHRPFGGNITTATGSQITTNKGNSLNPPPCPDKGPIPPNCTMKPVLK